MQSSSQHSGRSRQRIVTIGQKGPLMSPGDSDNRVIELAGDVRVDPADLRFSYSRAGGPGGQAVNKLATKVQLRVAVEALKGLGPEVCGRLRDLAGHRLTTSDELLFVADLHRSQLDNKRACLERLQSLVAEAVKVPKTRKKSTPSRAMIRRRLEAKRRQSRKKDARRARPDEESE